MADKKIQITDILNACLDFKKDPTTANELKITELKEKMILREYIPLQEKTTIMALILGLIPDTEYNAFTAAQWVVMGKYIYGLLSYAINLDNNLDRLLLTPSVIDLLTEFGFFDTIMNHCAKDYGRLEQMVDEALNFSNIFKLTETMSLIDTENLTNFVKEIREFKKEFTPEMLKDFKAIIAKTSPLTTALQETLVEDAVEKVMDENFKDIEEPAQPESEPEKQPEEPKEA